MAKFFYKSTVFYQWSGLMNKETIQLYLEVIFEKKISIIQFLKYVFLVKNRKNYNRRKIELTFL